MRAHRGSDFWYVIDGRADLHYGGRTYRLTKGQTARFSATIPHGLANPHSEMAALVALCSVPLW